MFNIFQVVSVLNNQPKIKKVKHGKWLVIKNKVGSLTPETLFSGNKKDCLKFLKTVKF
jgi:hypothetical protein